ncbi:glycosyltransferase involved in cell wall biosynthesis [Knoellia remsis]|uniref:Glycosyltransferase involved in cell wall biosynthesis n=1 Tax=Knoellia remsis TaxID=407159 RepID=A0A2T0UZF0_9MICO|nr:glycosyltransferase involved in cell wall biosynthesis [Knoellia remsis]
MREQRIVMLAYVLPHDAVPHAGGRYVAAVHEFVSRHHDVMLLTADTTVNRRAAQMAGAPRHQLVTVRGPLGWLTTNVDRWWRRLDPGAPYLPYAVGLLISSAARSALREADIVDLQWEDSIRLAPLVRQLSPHARVVGTFHDVQSQSFAREPRRGRWSRVYWRAQTALARRRERRLVRQLDTALTFSAKDAALLGSPANLTVVRPPLGAAVAQPSNSGELVTGAGSDGAVVFVSYLARVENARAAAWLLEEIWPLVREQLSTARLRIVGGGASAHLVAMVDRVEGAELTGFVASLDEVYAGAGACVVPLREGAGVKFKVVEALLHAVPTVTTTVGAEGIDGPDLFAAVTDDPALMAAALVQALTDPTSQLARWRRAQAWAERAFGSDQFEDEIASAYGLT